MRDRPIVLVVDDDPAIVTSLGWLLSRNAYEVRTASTGAQAVERVGAESIDLVLLDLLLPDADGAEVLAAVKAASPSTAVIMVSGVLDVRSVVACLRNGAFDYVGKPCQTDELLTRVANALRQKRLEEDFGSVSSRLQLSESHYQYLVQNSPDMIYTLDAGGRFTFVSGAAADILGYQPADLLGKHYGAVVHPDDIHAGEKGFSERRSERRGGSVTELRLLRNPEADGRGSDVVHAEVKAKGLYDDGGYRGTYGVARDHTRRIATERELRRQQAFFRQLFENSPEAIALVDADNRVRGVNTGFSALFGYERGECEGRDLHELIVPFPLREAAAAYSKTVLAQGLLKVETERRRKDGAAVDVGLSAFPIELDGDQIGMYAVYTDISDRKSAEKTVQETLAKLRGAMGAVIHVMVSTVEARDPYTAGHQQRVSNLARAIGRKMKLPAEMIDGIRMAGTIHDLGKIKIPAEILSNPAAISAVEFGLIKIHPKVAYDILKSIEFEWPVAEAVYQHHERMDGSGYPRGLKGEEICPEARVLTVADVVEAIASHRPYRPARGVPAALEEVAKGRGSFYDPEVVDACLELFGKDGFRFHAD